jgi:hypothetical protein
MHKLNNTILTAALFVVPGTAWAQTSAVLGERPVPTDQVSFYTVPLACPAARGLGCASAAKPVLLGRASNAGRQQSFAT